MNVQIDVNKAIEQISNKLGVAAEKLYPALYKQAMIDGSLALVWTLVSLIFIVISLVWLYKIYKIVNDKNNYKHWDDYAFQLITIILVLVISPIAFCVNLPDFVTAFFNTDYYILKQIIH